MNPKAYLVFLGGQSNPLGAAPIAGGSAPDLALLEPGRPLYARNTDTLWHNVRISDGIINNVGPEHTLSRSIEDTLTGGDKLYLYEQTLSGTSLDTIWKPNGGTNYPDIINDFERLMHLIRHGDVVFAGSCWVHGEADAANEAQSLAYEGNIFEFERFIANHMSLDPGNTPFVFAELAAFQSQTYKANVNAALAALAAAKENVHSVSVAGLTDKGDGIHYNLASQNILGPRLAAPIIDFIAADTSMAPGLGSSMIKTNPVSGWPTVTTPAELATAMGFANPPTHMWILNEDGVATDLAGAVDLTASGSPDSERSDFSLDAVTMDFTGNTTDALDAAASGEMDVGAESMALLVVGRLTELPGSSMSMVGKKDGSAVGYEILANTSGHLLWFAEQAGGSNNLQSIAQNHYDGTDDDPHVILAVNDHNANLFQMWSGLGATPIDTALTASLANSIIFSIGQGRVSALGFRGALVAGWIGTDGEGLNNTHRAALNTHLYG